jgi:hypothetical protein
MAKRLRGSNPREATVPHGLPTALLKKVLAAVAPSVTLLYQALLDQRLVPEDWMEANAASIFKKGTVANRPTTDLNL